MSSRIVIASNGGVSRDYYFVTKKRRSDLRPSRLGSIVKASLRVFAVDNIVRGTSLPDFEPPTIRW